VRLIHKAVDLDELHSTLGYDALTGVFRWKVGRPGLRPGTVAGNVGPYGYVRICINRTSFEAHRLAWFYVYGVWPANVLDHVNRVRADNRIANLREATKSQNAINSATRRDSSTRIAGVCWSADKKKWRAYITKGQKQRHVGYFDAIEDATSARASAVKEHFGEFAP